MEIKIVTPEGFETAKVEGEPMKMRLWSPDGIEDAEVTVVGFSAVGVYIEWTMKDGRPFTLEVIREPGKTDLVDLLMDVKSETSRRMRG
jgi:hypothetical protein